MATGKIHTFEERFAYKNGKVVNMISNKVPLRNENNAIIGIIGISFDLTEQFASFSKEKEEKFLLEKIINHLPVHIYWKDNHGVYIGCNDAQAKSIGLKSGNDVIGKTDYDLSWKNQAFELQENDRHVMKTGEIQTLQELSDLPNGTTAVFLSKKIPLQNELQKTVGVLGVSIDITAEKEAEKLKREKLAAEKQAEVMRLMSAAIAHELQTPQAAINLHSAQLSKVWSILLARYEASLALDCDLPKLPDMLYQHLAKDNLGEKLSRMNQHCCTIVNIMNKNVLQGELNGQTIPFSVKPLIEAVIKDFPYKSRLEPKLIKGILGDDFMVRGDPDLFTHVILNLLKNAIYHVLRCEKGHVEIQLVTTPKHHILYFEDTGPGIPEAHIAKIFDSFFTQGTANGTGVGLALCKNVIENNMKGKIWCESTLGEFTRFCLQLPKPSDLNSEH